MIRLRGPFRTAEFESGRIRWHRQKVAVRLYWQSFSIIEIDVRPEPNWFTLVAERKLAEMTPAVRAAGSDDIAMQCERVPPQIGKASSQSPSHKGHS